MSAYAWAESCKDIYLFYYLFINSSFKSAYSRSVDQGAVQLNIYICKRNNIILINLSKC